MSHASLPEGSEAKHRTQEFDRETNQVAKAGKTRLFVIYVSRLTERWLNEFPWLVCQNRDGYWLWFVKDSKNAEADVQDLCTSYRRTIRWQNDAHVLNHE